MKYLIIVCLIGFVLVLSGCDAEWWYKNTIPL